MIGWFSGNEVLEWLPDLFAGALVTLRIAALAFALALALGLAVAVARLSGGRLLRTLAGSYVEVFRGTPLLTQMLIVYFSLASLGLTFTAFTAAVIAITLNSGAYLSEIFRAGILSIDHGQREASLSIGMREPQVLFYIVLPQAFRVMIPPIAHYAVITLKSTSLASAITAPELMMQAHSLSSEYFRPTEIYGVAALFYVAIAYPLSIMAHLLEKRLSKTGVSVAAF
ncbi:ABC transporter permease subunit [Rhizobium lusitanum]|uniref:ABC transporter permease subunit n=1 Tax=Rhizobium lusitanum TaxID=293958 RepID=A0A6L9UE00_9HYPH|nr:amino acid ABC transporter permease [Rhizobium lusitanum]NEI73601.1 ABC transporter permease subunit [Rhizobium lusitanum]